jgi:hypothetical protein
VLPGPLHRRAPTAADPTLQHCGGSNFPTPRWLANCSAAPAVPAMQQVDDEDQAVLPQMSSRWPPTATNSPKDLPSRGDRPCTVTRCPKPYSRTKQQRTTNLSGSQKRRHPGAFEFSQQKLACPCRCNTKTLHPLHQSYAIPPDGSAAVDCHGLTAEILHKPHSCYGLRVLVTFFCTTTLEGVCAQSY